MSKLGNLTATLSNIWPAVEATTGIAGERNSKNKAFVQAVAETNARLAAQMLLDRSPTMSGLVDAGSLKVVAAMHDIGTGRVIAARLNPCQPRRVCRTRRGSTYSPRASQHGCVGPAGPRWNHRSSASSGSTAGASSW